jgi:hypothetical protein
MPKKPGTAPAQFVQIFSAVGIALASIVDEFPTGKLINSLSKSGERLTQFLRLTFTALVTDRVLAVVDEVATSSNQSILEHACFCQTPQVERFVVADFFTTRNSRVKIRFIGETLQKVFGEKIEENVQAAMLRAYRLTANELDPWIIVALGKNSYRTSLAQIARLMEQQPNGEEGSLLNNGRANVFYVPDDDGNLWAVGVGWRGGGWVVCADSIGDSDVWSAGFRVFARDSQSLAA